MKVFVNDDNELLLGLDATASTFAKDIVGQYPIKLSMSEKATSDFYEFVKQDGILSIYATDGDNLPTAIIPGSLENANFLVGFEIKVFSRNGKLIYEGKDGWNGCDKSGKVVPAGIYYYVATSKGGETFKGSVEVYVKTIN